LWKWPTSGEVYILFIGWDIYRKDDPGKAFEATGSPDRDGIFPG
jgi:hypothetical protein